VICSNHAGRQRPDTVGYPVEGVEIRIDDCGVLWTRGPHVMLRYWQDEIATALRIQDGWLCTEDLAEMDGHGAVRILGRADDQITLSTGYKVAPLELTQRLANDPWIESLVILGHERPYLAALVTPRVEELPKELLTWDSDSAAQSVDLERLNLALTERWQKQLSDLPRSMQIARIALLPTALTIENGGLNSKGAVRRQFVELVLYRELVDHLYAQASGQ
jgi:long-chain acyl-CoA synthetase